jgi:TolA-binding protein
VVRGGYADAADAYITSMRKAPQGELAPNAMVGLAITMRELGNKEQACNALGSLTAQYPNAGADVQEKARIETARTGC